MSVSIQDEIDSRILDPTIGAIVTSVSGLYLPMMKLDYAWSPHPSDYQRPPAAAEDLGFDGIFVPEIDHDPFLALSVAAVTTRSIELATGIAVAFARTPMTTALAGDDLQRCSEGRFVLGLGTQVRAHIERRFSMPWSAPVQRMEEYVGAVRAIWRSWQTGEPLNFDGAFYHHTLMTPAFTPGPNPYGAPRIFIAAVGPRMARMAGRVADGVVLHAFNSPEYIESVVLPSIMSGLDENGRSRDAIEITHAAFVATAAHEHGLGEATARVRELVSFYASTRAYRPVLEFHGLGSLQADLNDLARRGAWETMPALVDDDTLRTFAVVAPLDRLADELTARYRGLVDRLTFPHPSSSLEEVASFVTRFGDLQRPA